MMWGVNLSGIKSMYVDSSACQNESEQFRIDSGVRHVPLAVQCIYGWSNEGGEDGDGKEGSELPGEWERVEIPCPLVYR